MLGGRHRDGHYPAVRRRTTPTKLRQPGGSRAWRRHRAGSCCLLRSRPLLTSTGSDLEGLELSGTSPLLRRIRESVIGDDQVMVGPFGPRRVTYADYTASGRALGVHRGLHPRRGAAALRQHAHRIVAGRGCRRRRLREDARRIIRDAVGGTDDTVRDLLRIGLDRRRSTSWSACSELRIPSALDDRYDLSRTIPPRPAAGRLHRPVRASLQRAAVARVDRRRRDDPRGRRRPRRPRAPRGASSVAVRRPAAEDRLVLGRLATSPASSATRARSRSCCTGTALSSFWDFAAAAPYVEIEMSPSCPEHPLAYKDAIFSRRTSSSAARARRACSSSAASCSRTACPTSSAAARSPT